MTTFTAKIKRASESDYKIIPNAVNLRGFVAQKNNDGTYKFYYDSKKIAAQGYDNDFIRSYDEKNRGTQNQISDPVISQFLIRFDSPDWNIINADEEKAQKELQKQKEIESGKSPLRISDGIFGYTIHDRLSKDLFNKIRSHAQYVKGDESDLEWADDMGYFGATKRDVQGWYYTGGAIVALHREGVLLEYKGRKITSLDEIRSIRDKDAKAAKEISEKEQAKKEKERALQTKLIDLLQAAELPTKDVCDKISDMPRIYIGKHEGANIYGGGTWFHIDDNFLYYVKNNGMDGDDWSRNNYSTGGAGAICYRIKLADAKEYIDSMEEFHEQPFYAVKKDPGYLDYLQKAKKSISREFERLGLDRINLSEGRLDSDKCLLVEVADTKLTGLFLGVNIEKDRFYVATRMQGVPEFSNRFITGYPFVQVSVPLTDYLYATWKGYVPEWVNALHLGRFKVDGYIAINSVSALTSAWWHRFPVNKISVRQSVRPIRRGKTHVGPYLLIWDDGVKTTDIIAGIGADQFGGISKHAAATFEKHQQVAAHFGVEMPAEVIEIEGISKLESELIKKHCSGFDFRELLGAVEIKNIELKSKEYGRDQVTLTNVELKYADGTINAFFQVYAVFVSYDDVDETDILFKTLEEAEQSYKSYLR